MSNRKYPRSDDMGAYAPLEQNLVAPEGDLPTMTATPMIEVIAPSTLSEGYQFDAKLGDRIVQITVPKGGVEGGQKFMIPLPEDSYSDVVVPKLRVPVGHWKDGICDCFTYGPCHNHCCMACFCPLVAAGQVIARLKFTVWGKPGSPAESAGAFRKIMIFTVAYTCISFLIFVVEVANASMVDEPTPFIFALMVIRRLMHYVFLALLVFITWNLRANVRSKYAIPEDESCNTGCEDLLCAVCCNHLSIAQLLRHTTDYETYNATCCTETGVPPHVPSIV